MQVESRLAQLGFVLPSAPPAAGKYAPSMSAHGLLFISGQMPLREGRLEFPGRVGMELSEADGGAAARLAALNVLAQIHAALHGFDRLISLLRVDGYVSSSPGWGDQPRVLDSASQLFLDALGEKGRHARTAFAVPQLPFNASIELVVTAAVVA